MFNFIAGARAQLQTPCNNSADRTTTAETFQFIRYYRFVCFTLLCVCVYLIQCICVCTLIRLLDRCQRAAIYRYTYNATHIWDLIVRRTNQRHRSQVRCIRNAFVCRSNDLSGTQAFDCFIHTGDLLLWHSSHQHQVPTAQQPTVLPCAS